MAAPGEKPMALTLGGRESLTLVGAGIDGHTITVFRGLRACRRRMTSGSRRACRSRLDAVLNDHPALAHCSVDLLLPVLCSASHRAEAPASRRVPAACFG